jgi:diguanylate cyclase (GGDEF)-like protein/PAS domain S-box-containing protein/putative nucleotidyltransferase with HDIG domain
MDDDFYRGIIAESSYGYAYIKVLTDAQEVPVDLEFVEVNEAFAHLFSFDRESVPGKRARDLFSDELTSDFNRVAAVGRIGLTGRRQNFVYHLDVSDRWISVRAFCPELGFVVLQIVDVSQEIKRLRIHEGIFNLTPILLCVIDFDGKFIMANDEWTASLGYPKQALLNARIYDYLHPNDLETTETVMKELGEDHVIRNFVNRYLAYDGSCHSLEWRVYVSEGLIYGAARDITDQLAAEKQKQRELDLMNLLFDQTLTGMYMMMLDEPVDWKQSVDKDATLEYILCHQRVVRTNQAFWDQYGATREQVIGKTFVEFFKTDMDEVRKAWRRLLDQGRINFETEDRRMDGTPLYTVGDYSCIYDSKGRVVGYFGMQLDMTDRKEGEVALEKSERMYRLMAEHASDVIWVFDLMDKSFSYMSPSVQQFLGYSPEELMVLPFGTSLHPADIAPTVHRLRQMISEFKRNPGPQNKWTFQVRHRKADGTIIWADASINFRYTETGNIEAIGVSRDVTSRKLNEEKILHLSYRDQLTGLYNRRYFEEHQRTYAEPASLPLTMVVCDVNGLKLTNDVFGHQVGDQLLKACANVLVQAKRPDDVVARIGGDEFVLLFPNTSQPEAQERIDAIMHAVSQQVVGKTHLSVSFGAATLGAPVASLEPLFKEAEDIMYRRKLLESSSYKHDVIKLLINGLYEKGLYERKHSEKVSFLSYEIGKAMGLASGDLDELRLAGMLHDIGKIGIDTDVLNQVGPLDAHEWVHMRRHPEMGFQILRSVQNFGRIADWILSHHEQPDGKGYPQGLLDNEIPLQSKIIAVANAFDSMTSSSGFKHPLDVSAALAELQACAGTQFDPSAVATLVSLPREILEKDSFNEEGISDGPTSHA